ncbi:hypothetical protein DCE79_15955 [Lysinibacillus sp. 2017]|uniref:hypothetical protein n=1 Tax=unclassified Lysinibacillus TaxID=2636778 RepID=UPI000D52699A|nr:MULTISPECIES: hypothetical protein [unclassified Lysinibacillus]AWE08758.1 hypothetical protein DCE79_15955 [Lysinibacillus sp. 2017]TGN36080.1 hypothetical protein E4L99_06335 [Lysinibacillus sp. S2017]
MFDHHHPFASDYYTLVFGFSIVILVCLAMFIHYLRAGLHSHDSVVIDSKAAAFAPNEKSKDGHHHH